MNELLQSMPFDILEMCVCVLYVTFLGVLVHGMHKSMYDKILVKKAGSHI